MKTRNTIVTIAFILMLAVMPLATGLSYVQMMMTETVADQEDPEESMATTWEDETTTSWWDGLIHDRVNAFIDNNALESAFIRLNYHITRLLSGGDYIESTQVLLGKEGWLFYKTTEDGAPIEDYLGLNTFTDEEISTALEHMETARDVMNSQGREFTVMLIPNKERVYDEYLPDTIDKSYHYGRLEQLSDALAADGSIDYVDVTNALMEVKDEHQLYFKSDSHWNYMGAFVGLQAYFQQEKGLSETIENVVFNEEGTYQGDLARISGLTDYYSDIQYDLWDVSVLNELKADEDKVVFIVGDSFGEMMLPVVRCYYKQVHWIRTEDFSMSLMDEYDPDIVIWESVERYLSRFVDYDITSR